MSTSTLDLGDIAARMQLRATIVPDDGGIGGYRRLVAGPREGMVLRNELGGRRPSGRFRSLATFVQISDLHVADVQSPARAEFLDRLGDPDSPHVATFGRNRTYRAQESLNHHVIEAMTAAIRRRGYSPLSGAPPSFVVSTGDATDNCQRNELEHYISLLDGGSMVTADSGDRSVFDGVGGTTNYDVRYWHPEGTPFGEHDDLPRSRHGFPTVTGLLDASRRPFRSGGLGCPWYAVNGNHDALVAGIYPRSTALDEIAIGRHKPWAIDDHAALHESLVGNEAGPVSAGIASLGMSTRVVAADPMRRIVDAREWIAAHLESPGQPNGHGFNERALAGVRAYYGFDTAEIRFLVLDTVNRAGGWQGSLDEAQFNWLEEELMAGHSTFLSPSGRTVHHHGRDRLFVLFSHHPLADLTNRYDPFGAARFGSAAVEQLLGRFRNAIAWFNGHTHVNAVTPIARLPKSGGCWQVTTASHIDWPQQSRAIEIAADISTGNIVIATEMIDHSGFLDPRQGELDDPHTLAGWSRELAANAWQARTSSEEPLGRGTTHDRNVALVLGSSVSSGRS